MARDFARIVLLPMIVIFMGIHTARADGSYKVCFRPHGASCEAMLDTAIDAARFSIDAEVYNYTLPSVGDALVRAKGRGVKVRVIVDKITPTQKGEQTTKMLATGIPTWVDCPVAIHHDKVAIIDGERVISGSYNWSANAERRNAENAVEILDPLLAAAYTADFEDQLKSSIPLTKAVCHGGSPR
jgi:phosphatidylserine/phosphatidylglycerophosphate/cardiolipin synthase-like enzyme